jgi:hypothetical protein
MSESGMYISASEMDHLQVYKQVGGIGHVQVGNAQSQKLALLTPCTLNQMLHASQLALPRWPNRV